MIAINLINIIDFGLFFALFRDKVSFAFQVRIWFIGPSYLVTHTKLVFRTFEFRELWNASSVSYKERAFGKVVEAKEVPIVISVNKFDLIGFSFCLLILLLFRLLIIMRC